MQALTYSHVSLTSFESSGVTGPSVKPGGASAAGSAAARGPSASGGGRHISTTGATQCEESSPPPTPRPRSPPPKASRTAGSHLSSRPSSMIDCAGGSSRSSTTAFSAAWHAPWVRQGRQGSGGRGADRGGGVGREEREQQLRVPRAVVPPRHRRGHLGQRSAASVGLFERRPARRSHDDVLAGAAERVAPGESAEHLAVELQRARHLRLEPPAEQRQLGHRDGAGHAGPPATSRAAPAAAEPLREVGRLATRRRHAARRQHLPRPGPPCRRRSRAGAERRWAS